MRRALSRLRWQLTLSHLIAIAFTLVFMIAAAVLIVGLVFGRSSDAGPAPVEDARTVAQAIGGLAAGGEPAELNGVLRALADGTLRVRTETEWDRPGPPQDARQVSVPLRDLAYIAVVGPNGRLLGSSDPAGAAFSPPERGEWTTIVDRARSGERDRDGLLAVRDGEGPAALGGYPILDASGQPVATVVLAKTAYSPSDDAFNVLQALAIFSAATVAVLSVASVFALASASVVAYLLSRRLVARLERLGEAVESLAAGDLTSRAPEGGTDEVGQLAQRFNVMAADLERTVHDLEDERDRVAGLLEARRQLVAGVSHELRTPVATIRGYLESALPRRNGISAELRADLETMEREVVRLQHLIEDLFTLSRAEVGRLSLRLEPTDAGTVVRRLVETIAPLAWGQRRVQVIAEVAPDVPLVSADGQRLEQIVSNLLGNAVRHTAPGGLVAVVVGVEPDAVRIEVRDTGEGIDPEDLPRVFERFYRGSGDGAGGAGLGLALVKELVEAMGGAVEVVSELGEGSCFTVRLARGTGAAPTPGPPSPSLRAAARERAA